MSGIHNRDQKLLRAARDAISSGCLTAVGAANCYFVPFFGGWWWSAVGIMGMLTLFNLALAGICFRSEDLGPL